MGAVQRKPLQAISIFPINIFNLVATPALAALVSKRAAPPTINNVGITFNCSVFRSLLVTEDRNFEGERNKLIQINKKAGMKIPAASRLQTNYYLEFY